MLYNEHDQALRERHRPELPVPILCRPWLQGENDTVDQRFLWHNGSHWTADQYRVGVR